MVQEGIHFVIENVKTILPEVSEEGLQLWYDAKGKKNTDNHKDILLDMSGSKRHGRLENFMYAEGSGYLADTNGGLTLDGVNDYIVSKPVSTGASFVLEMYLKIEEAPTKQCIFSLVNQSHQLAVIQNGTHIELLKDGVRVTDTTASKTLTGNPHLFTCIVSAGKMKVYLDGTLLFETTAWVYESQSLTAVIGCNYPNIQHLRGTLYSARLYGLALADTDILHNYEMELERWKTE